MADNEWLSYVANQTDEERKFWNQCPNCKLHDQCVSRLTLGITKALKILKVRPLEFEDAIDELTKCLPYVKE